MMRKTRRAKLIRIMTRAVVVFLLLIGFLNTVAGLLFRLRSGLVAVPGHVVLFFGDLQHLFE